MTRRVLAGRFPAFAVALSLATIATAQTQTTTETQKGASAASTYELSGEVAYVEGNSLVVKMADGGVRTFNVPETRRFVIDGKEISVHELTPGTKLKATVTTTTTPVKVRTTTVGSGRVWFAMGRNVILTMPNGENKQFLVGDDTQFTVEGKPASVDQLRKGMVVSAAKVVEEPMTEIATNTTVVGQAPPPAPPAAAKAEAAPTAAPAADQAAPAVQAEPPAAPVETSAPAAPVETPAAPVETPAAPKSGGLNPAIWIGLLLVVAAIVIWVMRKK